MSRIVIAIVIIYPIVAAIGGAAALLATLWAYNTDARMVSDTVTAAVINTAAAVAASGFVGGFEMILSLWQFMKNHEAEQARQQERLEDKARWEQERQEERARQEQERQEERVQRQEERARQEQERQEERIQREQERARQEQERIRQEQERVRQEQERAEDRKAMQAMQSEFLAQLKAEGERNAVLAAKVLELSELAINRAADNHNGGGNGSGNDGDAEGEPGRQPPVNHSV